MTDPTGTLTRPPTGFDKASDRAFRGLTVAASVLAVLLVVAIVAQIGRQAEPAVREYGVEFLTTSKWDPSGKKFGVVPQVAGTLYSSVLGVALGSLFGVTVAVFLTQNFLPPRLEALTKSVVELLSAVPSVVYGLWGIFVVIPAVRPVANALHDALGGVPFFGTRLAGPGLLPAAFVLAIMVLPTVTAISRDALAAVPGKLREAAYGLGATRWEVILKVVLPTASRGVFGAIVLAFGRAVGETMAVAMLIGNSNTVSWSLFAPGNTLAGLVANQWPEAGAVEKGALMYAGLVLLGITLAINSVGTLILRRTVRVEEAHQ